MKTNYDLLILGATSLAAGILASHPGLSAVVLENTSTIAGEFGDAWKSDNAARYDPKSQEAITLREEFVRRHAMTEAGEWIPAIQPILADCYRKSGADVYFFAALKELAAEADAYRITFSAFGIDHSFCAKTVIDTTAQYVSRAFLGGDVPKYASITLNHVDTGFTVHKTPCESLVSAREEIVRNYHDILKIASEPAYTTAELRRDLGAAAWVPSAAHGNFLAAFDFGAGIPLPEGTRQTIVSPSVDDGAYDVIVVGLGTAGAIAAVTAHEEGLSVLGLENLSVSGGAGTAGTILSYYFGFKGGVYSALDAETQPLNEKFVKSPGIGADQKIVTLDRAMAGCDFRYRVMFTDVIREGNRVVGAVWYENGIRHEARSKFVIDTSADSAACVNAGCEMIGGRESDGTFQPYSSVFYRYADKKLSWGYCDNGRMNQYDPDEFGSGIVNASASYVHLRNDYSAHDYLGVAPLIGLREGLRIAGEETVEFPVMIEGGWHKKPVYYGWSNLDNHGKDNALESRYYQDWNTICGMWGWGMTIPVPMGALIPRGFDGILAAGRNVSIDHDIAMGLRMKDDVQKSGEAAARIAAMAIREGIPAREVDSDALREKLFASQCLKPEDEVIRIEKQRCDEVHEFPLWESDDAKITEGLASDAPAYFMWSARTLDKRELLLSLLDCENENTRINAALSLALLGQKNDRSVQILLDCAGKRDGYIAKAGRKYIPPRSIAAIYALGRIAAAEAVPLFFDMLADDSFIETLPYEPYDFLPNREDYYFQYRSHIITALCDIASAHTDLRQTIKQKLTAYVSGRSFTVTLMGPVIRYDDTAVLKKRIEQI